MKKALGVLLLICLPFLAAGQDKQKKAYELMYEDIQLLKQQYVRLEKKIDADSDGIKAVRDLLRELTNQFKLFQADQARSQENIKNLPSQYQAFLEKLNEIETQVLKIAEELTDLKLKPAPPVEQPQETPKKEEKTTSANAKKTRDVKRGETAAEKPEKKVPDKTPIQTNLSSQEVYNTAYTDYQKGSFDLAVDGFLIYRDQFPASPLADNALFMIGECYFSQKKYDKAIDQFDELIASYPLSDAIAGAYYKKALALAELKKKEDAVAVLRFLISKYPLEEDAKKAQEKLKEIQGIK